MLSFDDERWNNLTGGYKTPFDPRPSLRKLENQQDTATASAATLGERLSIDVTKTSAVDFQQRVANSPAQTLKEHTMQRNKELKPEHNEQQPRRLTAEQIEHNRHYAPVEAALRSEASGYEWKHERAGIQSYRHNQTSGWLHIDSQGQFFDRHAQPISREIALEHARHSHAHSVGENAQSLTSHGRNKNDLGMNL